MEYPEIDPHTCSHAQVLDLSEACVEISKEDEPSTKYDLQSVVIHVGGFGSGHYYAYVRPDICSSTWYRFNDHQVTKVSLQEVLKDAYGGSSGESSSSSFLGRLLAGKNSFGWGGRESSAYMIQYVKREEIVKLYNER